VLLMLCLECNKENKQDNKFCIFCGKAMQNKQPADSAGSSDEVIIVKTDEGAESGQFKCPKCGATDIAFIPGKEELTCNFCRHEFKPEKFKKAVTDISELKGTIIGSGAQNIVADTKDIITFKCTSCGAEVVVDTTNALQARCHWCRNTLSVNEQIPNGAVPDKVLPFKITKENAQKSIEEFVNKRKFFAYPKFKLEFTTENILGVYMPYMVVDANTYADLSGDGEILVRRYTRGTGDNKTTYYDADLYHIRRTFDMTVEGLTIESSADKLKHDSKENTNNIINAIMPFDTENSIRWNANYLKGFNSEKRDTNVDDLTNFVDIKIKDIARSQANDTIEQYDRGVKWVKEDVTIKGKQWKAAYMPVWLYSYQQKNGNNKKIHYVAVNARTEKTMGSVPINYVKLILFSILVQIAGIICTISIEHELGIVFLLSGFSFYGFIYNKYRNKKARHMHEIDTKAEKSSITKNDLYVTQRKGLRNRTISGQNNLSVNYNDRKTKLSLSEQLFQSDIEKSKARIENEQAQQSKVNKNEKEGQ